MAPNPLVWPPQPFNGKRFEVWETQMDMFLTASNITDDKEQGLSLLQHIGFETLEKLIDWAKPKKPKELGYIKLTKILENHYGDTPNLFAKRVQFFSEKQKSGQSVQEYIAHMSQLLGQCEMTGLTPDDYGILGILHGLQSDELRDYLMDPVHAFKEIDKLREKAVVFEQTRNAAKDIKSNMINVLHDSVSVENFCN